MKKGAGMWNLFTKSRFLLDRGLLNQSLGALLYTLEFS